MGDVLVEITDDSVKASRFQQENQPFSSTESSQESSGEDEMQPDVSYAKHEVVEYSTREDEEAVWPPWYCVLQLCCFYVSCVLVFYAWGLAYTDRKKESEEPVPPNNQEFNEEYSMFGVDPFWVCWAMTALVGTTLVKLAVATPGAVGVSLLVGMIVSTRLLLMSVCSIGWPRGFLYKLLIGLIKLDKIGLFDSNVKYLDYRSDISLLLAVPMVGTVVGLFGLTPTVALVLMAVTGFFSTASLWYLGAGDYHDFTLENVKEFFSDLIDPPVTQEDGSWEIW